MGRQLSAATAASRLHEHPFVKLVVDRAIRIEPTALQQSSATSTSASPLTELSEAEYHVQATSFALIHLIGEVEHVSRIPAYLRQYRRTSALATAGVTRAASLVYHLEGFLVRTTSFRDKCLQLCSAVCHTGINRTAVNQRVIATNGHVRSNGLKGRLDQLEKICSPFSQARNQVVHQHGLLDEALNRVEMFLVASRVADPPVRTAAAAAYRSLVAELGDKKAEEVEAFARSAIDFTADFLSALEPVYSRRQRQLSVEE